MNKTDSLVTAVSPPFFLLLGISLLLSGLKSWEIGGLGLLILKPSYSTIAPEHFISSHANASYLFSLFYLFGKELQAGFTFHLKGHCFEFCFPIVFIILFALKQVFLIDYEIRHTTQIL